MVKTIQDELQYLDGIYYINGVNDLTVMCSGLKIFDVSRNGNSIYAFKDNINKIDEDKREWLDIVYTNITGLDLGINKPEPEKLRERQGTGLRCIDLGIVTTTLTEMAEIIYSLGYSKTSNSGSLWYYKNKQAHKKTFDFCGLEFEAIE